MCGLRRWQKNELAVLSMIYDCNWTNIYKKGQPMSTTINFKSSVECIIPICWFYHGIYSSLSRNELIRRIDKTGLIQNPT